MDESSNITTRTIGMSSIYYICFSKGVFFVPSPFFFLLPTHPSSLSLITHIISGIYIDRKLHTRIQIPLSDDKRLSVSVDGVYSSFPPLAAKDLECHEDMDSILNEIFESHEEGYVTPPPRVLSSPWMIPDAPCKGNRQEAEEDDQAVAPPDHEEEEEDVLHTPRPSIVPCIPYNQQYSFVPIQEESEDDDSGGMNIVTPVARRRSPEPPSSPVYEDETEIDDDQVPDVPVEDEAVEDVPVEEELVIIDTTQEEEPLQIPVDETPVVEIALQIPVELPPLEEVPMINLTPFEEVLPAAIPPVADKKRKIEEVYDSTNGEEEYQQQRQPPMPLRKRIKKIDGDGDCLYRSISDQLYGNQEFRVVLRNLCADYLKKHPELQAFETAENIAKSFNIGEMAGDLEISVLSELLDCRINIYYQGEDEPSHFYNPDASSGDVINLLFRNAHYDSYYPSSETPLLKRQAGAVEKGILGRAGQYLPSSFSPKMENVKIEAKYWDFNKGFFFGHVIDSVIATRSMLACTGLKCIGDPDSTPYYHKVHFEDGDEAWIQHGLLHALKNEDKDYREEIIQRKTSRNGRRIKPVRKLTM